MTDMDMLVATGESNEADWNTVKAVIKGIVATDYGIKGIELVSRVLTSFANYSWTGPAPCIPTVIRSLVADGELIEVEVTLESMPYRVKSIYFPANTQLKVLSTD